jgi:hypothetical protein
MIAGTWLRLVRKDDGLDPSRDEAREERRVFVQDVRMPALTRSHVVGRCIPRTGGWQRWVQFETAIDSC